MNRNFLLSSIILAAGLFAGCASPGPTYVVASAPPAAVAEVIPASPGPGWYWVRGHYAWRAGRYVWVLGHYIRTRPGAVWVEGRYENRGGSYFWIDGYWR